MIEWQLRAVMRRRRVGVPELTRRLRSAGYPLSESQVYRLAAARHPKRVSAGLLEALCTALDCEIADLLVRRAPSSRVPSPPRVRVPRA